MSSFTDLTKLLESDPSHRLVIVREDGSPVGVLLTIDAYRSMIHKKAMPSGDATHSEWDAMMEKVSGAEESAATEDTYLFEPVE